MAKNKNKEKAINYALKICISAFLLIAAYYALDMLIIKGQLFSIASLLMTLFFINAVIIGIKIFKK